MLALRSRDPWPKSAHDLPTPLCGTCPNDDSSRKIANCANTRRRNRNKPVSVVNLRQRHHRAMDDSPTSSIAPMLTVPLPYPGKVTAIPYDTVLVLAISKRFVEQSDVKDVLAFLNQLTESREAVFACRDRLVLSFEGYDYDPREIYTIPEVVQYFRLLNSEWPYWAWFCAKGIHQARTIIALLADARVVTTYAGRAAVSIDPQQLAAVTARLNASLQSLVETFQIPPAAAQAARDRWLIDHS